MTLRIIFTVISLIFLLQCSGTCGSPVAGDASEDYQNDYYADEEYYSDDYDASVETNEIFDASGNRETVVKRNPKFITPQKNLMVNEGETIKLPCVVDNLDQNFAIIWKKSEKIVAVGDNLMDETTDSRAKIEPLDQGNSLVYSLAEGDDSGDYTCTISALNTITLTHSVKVRVRPEIEAVADVVEVRAGETAELECRVTRGSPDPEIVWTRQSRPFVGGEETMRGSSLTFTHASRRHSGVYTCSADNGWGTPAEAKIHVNVLHKPEIEQEETFIHSRDGDEVEVVCIIHSYPKSEVEWYKNGQKLDPKKAVINVRGNRHTLLIQKIGDQDIHGKYDCRAWNKFGEDMATTEVSGKAAPANFKSEYMSPEDREFVLEWVVSSSTAVTEFQLETRLADDASGSWRPTEAEVHQVDEESFAGKVTLHDLAPATKYVARVAAKNAYGMSNFSPAFEFSTFNKYLEDLRHAASEPKHEKSVSASSTVSLSQLLCLLITAWILLR